MTMSAHTAARAIVPAALSITPFSEEPSHA